MVLEQLFKAHWIKRRPLFMFVLAFSYTLIGIGSALIIFGKNPSLMSVAFISILLIPSLNTLLKYEENEPMRKKKFSIFGLFKDHKDILAIYLFLFLGIFFAYLLYAFFLSATATKHIFSSQLDVAGIAGGATFNGEFLSILINNIIVLIACFLLSLVYGAGSILFLTWNASAWGAIFGFLVKESAASQNPLIAFGIVILPVLPHLITEAASYLSAAIVGGVVSKAVLREKLFSKKFNYILTDGLLLLIFAFLLVLIAAFLEVYMFHLL